MRRIIQIKGNHGAGKTTLVNNLIKSRNLRKKTLRYNGVTSCLLLDDKIVLWVYQKPRGCEFNGIDALIRDRSDLLAILRIIVDEFAPRDVIYEGAIYGETFKLAEDINKLAISLKYSYVNVFLQADFNQSIRHILLRNGGKPINFKAIQNKANRYGRLIGELERAGQIVHRIDARKSSPQEVLFKMEELLK